MTVHRLNFAKNEILEYCLQGRAARLPGGNTRVLLAGQGGKITWREYQGNACRVGRQDYQAGILQYSLQGRAAILPGGNTKVMLAEQGGNITLWEYLGNACRVGRQNYLAGILEYCLQGRAARLPCRKWRSWVNSSVRRAFRNHLHLLQLKICKFGCIVILNNIKSSKQTHLIFFQQYWQDLVFGTFFS